MSENAISQANRAQVSAPNLNQTAVKTLLHFLATVAASILSFSLFLLIREGVADKSRRITVLDHDLLLFCHRHQEPILTVIARGLALMGSPPVMVGMAIAATLLGLFDRRVRGAAWTVPIAVVGGGALIQVVKITFRRQRPDVFVPLLHETGYSFPSGHSLISVVVYGLLGFFLMGLFPGRTEIRRLIGALTALLILSIGASRVYVGVHYPTDVLAGWSLGIPWLFGCLAFHERLVRHYAGAGTVIFPSGARSSATKN